MALLGHDELAVSVADVGGELLAAPGGVDADNRGARERRATQGEDVLGHIVEKDADVERAGPALRGQHCRPYRALAHNLGPGPCRLFESQPDIRVAGTRGDQLGNGRRCHRPANVMFVMPRTRVERPNSGSPSTT